MLYDGIAILVCAEGSPDEAPSMRRQRMGGEIVTGRAVVRTGVHVQQGVPYWVHVQQEGPYWGTRTAGGPYSHSEVHVQEGGKGGCTRVQATVTLAAEGEPEGPGSLTCNYHKY